ncbi:hypothetical protein AAC387_Pa06g1463 [Persea americana]
MEGRGGTINLLNKSSPATWPTVNGWSQGDSSKHFSGSFSPSLVFPHPNLNSNFNSRQALGDSIATTLASLSDSTTSSTNSAVVSSRLASTYPQCNKRAKSDSLWVIASCCYSDIDSFPSGTSCNPYLPLSSLRDSSPLPAEHLVRRTPSANGSFISKKPSLRKANDSPSQSGKQISESLLRPAPSCLLSQANNTLDNPTQQLESPWLKDLPPPTLGCLKK